MKPRVQIYVQSEDSESGNTQWKKVYEYINSQEISSEPTIVIAEKIDWWIEKRVKGYRALKFDVSVTRVDEQGESSDPVLD